MIRKRGTSRRRLKRERLSADLVIVGGGLAGTCCALTAARAGVKVVLLQDRPVLGGNASSEVRLWILGATSHMGNNNRWAREGGVIDELLVENLYRNPEGNPFLVDALLLEKTAAEPNIRLLLNTAVHSVEKADAATLKSVRAFCSQNSTEYQVSAPLFCDASGDGIVGFLAGAAFRMGSEASSEFGEKLAPQKANRELLGNTLYFYSRDTGRPVRFVPPAFALKDITRIPRWGDFKVGHDGCRLWWLEWGGRLDLVHEAETVKWELWKIVYGVWDHIKNSGHFPEAQNLTLEWVGAIPGKRESRRFEGDSMLTQQDIVEQRQHIDAVSFGGWAIDLHPADGVFSEQPGCTQWHSKGVYQIPYRCLYSRNIANLFLAGRLISATHVAFGSTRVMATCAHNAQAVGMAAALCRREKVTPRELGRGPRLGTLQRALLRSGQVIPGIKLQDPDDLAGQASVTTSSQLRLSSLSPSGETRRLDDSWAMMLPVSPGPVPRMGLTLDVDAPTSLKAELRVSDNPDNYTPNQVLDRFELSMQPGRSQPVELGFKAAIDRPRYAFACLMANSSISVQLSAQRITGILSLTHRAHRAVAKSAVQEPPPDSGIDSFEFWIPQRRPGGTNFALTLEPALDIFGPENLVQGTTRPGRQPNAWVAAFEDPRPTVTLSWSKPQTVARLELFFDSDYDHPMESVLLGHPEHVMPFCVRRVLVSNHTPRIDRNGQGEANRSSEDKESRADGAQSAGGGRTRLVAAAGLQTAVAFSAEPDERYPDSATVLACLEDNYQSRRVIRFKQPFVTTRLSVELAAPGAHVPAALFAVRCYAH